MLIHLPHDRSYFFSQLKSVHNYFQSVSYDQFGIDLNESQIYPLSDTSYELTQEMSYYYPYNQEVIAEDRLVELFSESIEKAYLNDGVDYSNYDLIIVFHAGIGQDFSLPFLDPTPEDIPSTFIDPEMIQFDQHLMLVTALYVFVFCCIQRLQRGPLVSTSCRVFLINTSS